MAVTKTGYLRDWTARFNFDTGGICVPVRSCPGAGLYPFCRAHTVIRIQISADMAIIQIILRQGAFRGFGVCQSEFALESNINLLAEMVGISPWEIRYRNAIEPGKVLP